MQWLWFFIFQVILTIVIITMGVYFSLHSEAEWRESFPHWQTPSLWKTVEFQPLRGPGRNEPQLFFKRYPGPEDEVSFAYPNGIRHKDGVMRFGYHSVVSVLAAIDLERGRFYCGLLVEANGEVPHIYEHPARAPLDPKEIVDFPPRRKESSGFRGGEPGQTGSSFYTTGRSTGGSTQGTGVAAAMAEARRKSSVSQRRKESTSSTWFTQGISASAHIHTQEEQMDENLGVWKSFPLQFAKVGDPQDDLRKTAGGKLPLDVTECRYFLIHQVAEGILTYMSNDLETCAELLRDIAIPTSESDGNRSDLRMVRCLQFPVGRTTKVNGLAETVQRELERRFYVQRLSAACSVPEQDQCTNCAYFCARAIKSLHLSLRGFDIRHVAESKKEVANASETAATAWEEVWKSARI